MTGQSLRKDLPNSRIAIMFLVAGMMALCAGALMGCVGSLQYIIPGFLHDLPFFKSRPLHVSLIVSWIFLSAVGGIYYYLPRYCDLPWFSGRLARLQFVIFIVTGVVILASYIGGKFGGREYWEFPPALAIPVAVSWILFGINFFVTVFRLAGKWPVYMWMWGTGIFFFLFTFCESYLWIFPYFNEHIGRDLTVQWKAYGALVGSWNMLVYGTAIFVMEKIKGDDTIAKSKLSFLMYFLGFTNLLFGWAHHIYIVPAAGWIKYVAYLVSMSELLILARIIWTWRRSLSDAKKNFYLLPFRFLVASDLWILVNLILALLISVPLINIFSHGTHITVAHAMGSTIGINTMILLCSCIFIVQDYTGRTFSGQGKKVINAGFWLLNVSLFVFWIALIGAGAEKARLVIDGQVTFQEIMRKIDPFLTAFAVAGIGVFGGLCLVVAPIINLIIATRSKKLNNKQVNLHAHANTSTI